MQPEFLYFDLGKVLVDFSVERMCRQIATVADLEPAAVYEAIFSGGLQQQYESGRIHGRPVLRPVLPADGPPARFRRPARCRQRHFHPLEPMLPVVGQLGRGRLSPGHPLEHVRGPLGTLSAALSDSGRKLFGPRLELSHWSLQAQRGDLSGRSGVGRLPAGEDFLRGRRCRTCGGRRAAGFDAVQYTTTAELVEDLRKRGVEFNY